MVRRRYRSTFILTITQILILFFGVCIILGFTSLHLSPVQLTNTELLLVFIVIALCIGVLFVFILYMNRQLRRKSVQRITLQKIDLMSGVEFEDFVANLFEMQNYRVQKTATSGDLGVDLILSRSSEKIAVQVKRYTNTVGRSAISDVVAGMAHYKCQRCIVVTNSHFTPLAKKLAYSNRCQLIDREALIKQIQIVSK